MSTFTPDDDMLQQYIQQKLSPEDEEQLELWLAENPHVLEELELDLMMKENFQSPLTSEPTIKEHDNSLIYWFNFLTRPVAYIPLVLLIVSTAYFLINSNTINRFTKIEPNASIIYLSNTRGGGSSIKQPQKNFVVVLQLSQISQSEFTVKIAMDDKVNEVITGLSLQNYTVFRNGEIVFPLKPSSLTQGRNQFIVIDQKDNTIVSNIYIDIN